MLRVVLENLVANSIRYAGAGARCRVSTDDRNGVVTLTVADDGRASRPRTFERLFERFYRTDRARSSRGTGLGLAIVKHVVNVGRRHDRRHRRSRRRLTIRCRFPS